MRQADMELKKGQNIIEHEAEIYARPARTWFQTEKEKQNAKGKRHLLHVPIHEERANDADASKSAYVSSFPEEKKSFKSKSDEKEKPAIKRGKYDGLSRKLKRRKMAMEEDEADEQVSKNTAAAIRIAKKSAQPVKITEALPKKNLGKKGKDKKKKVARGRVGGGKGSAFDTPGGEREGMRAARTKVNLDKKGGKKGKTGGKGPRK